MRTLTLELHDGAAPVLTPAVLDRLLGALVHADEADLVVLQGHPGRFCDGLHLAATADPTSLRVGLQRLAETLSALQRCARPIVALVDGPALGGGLGLAAAADLVLATRRARFGLPETVMGLIPAVVFPVIAARTGVPRTRLMALGAPAASAEEACRWGLVDEVVDDLGAALQRHAARFRRMDAAAGAALKRLVAQHFGATDAYLDSAVNEFVQLAGQVSTRERLQRFHDGLTPWPDEAAS